MCVILDGTEKPLPPNLTKLSDNLISIVWRSEEEEGSFIYKRSTPFLTANELWCLNAMSAYGFAPSAWEWDKYTIRMTDLGKSQPVTNPVAFRLTCKHMLACLQTCGIRHGDLTKYAIIVKDNWPFLIDFAESRLTVDSRPDKRVEGDEYWLNKTVRLLIKESKQ